MRPESRHRFAGIELVDDAIPDESTILRFRHLLERHQLTERISGLVRGLLDDKRLLLKSGKIVDTTIIEAPPSTKNEAKARDTEMRQTMKGKDCHFGTKAHVGTDVNGLGHTLVTTDAAQSDVGQLPKLPHGEERELYGDQAYWSEMRRHAARARGTLQGERPPAPYPRKLTELGESNQARQYESAESAGSAPAPAPQTGYLTRNRQSLVFSVESMPLPCHLCTA